MKSMNACKILSTTAIGFLVFLSSGLKAADFVINNDLIVDGSACIGFDCVDGESFGFDTLRLKENNLRIKFDDTSNTASFPKNDWQLVANDSSNGGLERFSIEDVTGGKMPFTIEAGARSNALYIADSGRVGFGTNLPYEELHIAIGDTPGLRLEQNGSSGWTPQTWDVAGNETNFFIRDVTTGSKLPFRIRPGAPTSSIDIASSGNIGIGTADPKQALHVLRNGVNANLLVENSTAGGAKLLLKNTANQWIFNGKSTLRITSGGVVPELKLVNGSGNMIISGTLTTGGTTCGGGCDLVFHPETEIESIEQHATEMWKNSYLPAVGPTVENEPFNLTEKTGGMLNELEKAHIYIEQLHHRQLESELAIQQLRAENQALAARQEEVSLRYEEQLEQLRAMLIDLQLGMQPQSLLTGTSR